MGGFEWQEAEAAEAVKETADLPKRDLTPKELERLSDVVLAFSQKMTGRELYSYQKEFGWRIIFSLLREDSDEISGLISRQGGKTEAIAVVVCGCMVLLPALAKALPWESRISKFKEGLWVGIYGPNYELAGIMWKRMKVRLYSPEAKEALLDPDIDIDLTDGPENMTLPNGSFVDCGTASPQAKIEGKTYHLLILEESQDIGSLKVRASIHPMAAATAGTLVKVGTPTTGKSEFYETCRRNKRSDINNNRLRSRYRLHYEFDYTEVQKYNPRYRKYVTKERERLGADSDEFRMKYKLHWIVEIGKFVDPNLFEECGIKSKGDALVIKNPRWRDPSKRGPKPKIKFSRANTFITHDPDNENQVAAIDVGKSNSTVVTVARAFWDGGIPYADDMRYPIHISNWLELQGDNHEAQHPQIIDFLKNYNLRSVIVDATGKGDPVYSRIAAELEVIGITVIPFVFSAQSKDLGYKILLQEIQTKRLTYPAGYFAARATKWQRFYNQMVDLEKNWRGPMMVVNAPRGEGKTFDDYPDSLMMLCWLVNGTGGMEVEDSPNPFLGRKSKWETAKAIKEAGAWFRNVTNPRARTRPGRNSKWS